jgi:hypothetical protein
LAAPDETCLSTWPAILDRKSGTLPRYAVAW